VCLDIEQSNGAKEVLKFMTKLVNEFEESKNNAPVKSEQ
jgi:hypothetical protein